MSASLGRRFLDAEGRLRHWPSKQRDQRLVLEHLCAHFEPGVEYTEREVNDRLRALHTFEDWALLRRALFDFGLMDREADGSRYRRRVRTDGAG